MCVRCCHRDRDIYIYSLSTPKPHHPSIPGELLVDKARAADGFIGLVRFVDERRVFARNRTTTTPVEMKPNLLQTPDHSHSLTQ